MAADELYAGDVTFTMGDDSLAGAIEQGLHDAMVQLGLPGLTPDGRDDRLAFILGLAKGIVGYLVAHEDALTIPNERDTAGGHAHEGHVVIRRA